MKLYKSNNFFDERTEFTDNLYYSLVESDEFKGMFPPSDLAFGDLPSVGSVRQGSSTQTIHHETHPNMCKSLVCSFV